jgi:hypothetical protein
MHHNPDPQYPFSYILFKYRERMRYTPRDLDQMTPEEIFADLEFMRLEGVIQKWGEETKSKLKPQR